MCVYVREQQNQSTVNKSRQKGGKKFQKGDAEKCEQIYHFLCGKKKIDSLRYIEMEKTRCVGPKPVWKSVTFAIFEFFLQFIYRY